MVTDRDGRSAAHVAGVDLRRLSPADAGRLLEIVFTLARHGVVGVARRGPFVVLRPRRRAPRAVAVALRRSFADLGPTFVKLGQLIASSPGLFPSVLSEEFRSLLDALPPEPASRVRSVIERELHAPIHQLFAAFDDRPVAAASIAQVHEASLHDGTRVAVKVQRPHLRRRIERDLRLLHLLARALERAGRLGEMANPRAIVEDLAATLAAELDFRIEAEAMRQFRRNLVSEGHEPRVAVPVPIDAMVTARVLVMTYVDGKPIDLVAASDDRPDDLLDLGLEAVRVWLEGALRYGLFHGDVHAGNLFLDLPETVALLDFGIMGRFEDHTRRALTETLPAAIGPVVLQQQYERVRDVVEALEVTSRS
jgi:ubiquinone biosynthesis protein